MGVASSHMVAKLAGELELTLIKSISRPDGIILHLRAHRSGCQSVLEICRDATCQKDLCERAVHGLKTVTGFDRVMAAMMDGQISHQDAPGGGSVLSLLLPVRVAKEAAIVMPAPQRLAGHILPRRVLVVDDIAMNRDITGALLQHAGHVVTCAEGGAEAVAAVADGDYDVVLMDVRMPGVDGLEATRRIRALPGARGQVPVIALTAQAFTAQVETCREAGMDSHLAKHFAHDALLQAVANAAQVRSARHTMAL